VAESQSPSVTWIGHASALIDLAGERVLVDPLGPGRCRAIASVGTILITHSHIDHLNRWTLARLDKAARIIVPKGAGYLVSDLGFAEVKEVEPGDSLSIGKVDLCAVETRHDSGRWRKGDKPLCTGYVASADGFVVHHAGDVDFSNFDIFDALGERFAIDATLLPIGGMLPVWYYRWRKNALDQGVHIDPDTALHVAERLRAKAMIPVHWGTVNLRLGPASAPRRRLEEVAAQSGKSHLVRILSHGQRLPLKAPDEI
jgi:L-ascorbate metabolism protein UlaG (beta-lactamase superfamily)